MTDKTEDTNKYKIAVKRARISFPHLFQPKAFNNGGGTAKFSATFLLDKEKDAAQVNKLKNAIKELSAERFKDKRMPASDKLCLRDGDNMGRAEYEGYWVLTASESSRPTVVDKDLTPLVEADEVIYSGCYVNGFINLWAQDNQYGKRVNANLLGVQFVADGEPLSSNRRMAADEMFQAEAGDFSSDFGDIDPFS